MDHAQPAFDLLIAVQEDHAETLAQYLNEKNIERQRLTERITQEATALLADALSLKQCTLVAIGDGWPISVLGLVAGKLCNTHNRPVVLLSAGEGRIAGAGRSPDSFHLANAFSALSELFVRHGGHRNAGGFQLASSVTPLDFAKRFEEFALLTKVESSDEVQIADAQPWDIEVSLFDCDETLLRAIQLLEPFGQNNPEPILRIRNACLKDVRCVGVSQRHARVVLEQNGVIKQGIAFSLGNACSRIPVGTGVDCLVALEENSWNGISQCQLTIKKNLPMRSVRIYTDGGARGNPGPAAIGIVIRDLESDEEIRHGEVIGVTTNNQAEYRALLWALQKAASLGIEQVECYLDSELVVKQMRREYRVRDQALGVIF